MLFAGCRVMNFNKTNGWFYKTSYDRSASWTGVSFFAEFLLTNKGLGPYGAACALSELAPGDIVQLATFKDVFHHSPVVVEVSGGFIYVAAHTLDCDYRLLSSYQIKKMRPIHIQGCRKP